MELPDAYTNRLEVLRDLIAVYDGEITTLDRDIHLALRHHRGYQAIQAIHGVGRVFAAVFVAEIGDVSRFPSAEALCSWAGLTPSTASPTPRSPGAASPSKVQVGALAGHRGGGPPPRR